MLIGYHLTETRFLQPFIDSVSGSNLIVLILDCRDDKNEKLEFDAKNIDCHVFDVSLEDRNHLLDIVRNTCKNSRLDSYSLFTSSVVMTENLDIVSEIFKDENVGIVYSDYRDGEHVIFHTTPINMNSFPFIVFKNLPVENEAVQQKTTIENVIANTYIVKYLPKIMCQVVYE